MAGISILLSALRILGYILLALVGIALFLLLLVLLVPIRYHAGGELADPSCHETLGEEDKKALLANAALRADASWLFHLVRFSYCYPGEGGPTLCVLWLRILPRRKDTSKADKDQVKEKKPKETDKNKKKTALPLKRIAKELASSETKTAVRVILERSGKLLKGILPGKWELTGTVGLGDPGATGTLMEAEALIYPAVCGHMWVMPCMDGYRFDLHGEARGKISLGRIVWILASLWMQQEVRNFVSRIRNLRSE